MPVQHFERFEFCDGVLNVNAVEDMIVSFFLGSWRILFGFIPGDTGYLKKESSEAIFKVVESVLRMLNKLRHALRP